MTDERQGAGKAPSKGNPNVPSSPGCPPPRTLRCGAWVLRSPVSLGCTVSLRNTLPPSLVAPSPHTLTSGRSSHTWCTGAAGCEGCRSPSPVSPATRSPHAWQASGTGRSPPDPWCTLGEEKRGLRSGRQGQCMGKDVAGWAGRALRTSCPTLHVKHGEGGPERLADALGWLWGSGHRQPLTGQLTPAQLWAETKTTTCPSFPSRSTRGSRSMGHQPNLCMHPGRKSAFSAPHCRWGEPAGSVENACSRQPLVADPPSTLCLWIKAV